MPMDTRELDLRINEPLEQAFNDLTAWLATRFTREISQAKWQWPRDPSPRDIVDKGGLRKSLRISQPLQRGSLVSVFQWTAPYAPHVHDGAIFKRTDAEGNPLTLTARPWTRPVLRDSAAIRKFFQLRFALAMKAASGRAPEPLRQPPAAPPAGGGPPP